MSLEEEEDDEGGEDNPWMGGTHDGAEASTEVVSEKRHGDGKVERLFADGRRVLVFSNGTQPDNAP
ncbi:hypothetical protein T484DRAFT_1813229 [Baffinella frigidus]|nr:hypothetical protein T484DRAFT_1813229 [Cryptophyta sp. CCMP2293]